MKLLQIFIVTLLMASAASAFPFFMPDADTLTINELNAKTALDTGDLFLISQTPDTNYYKVTWNSLWGAVEDTIKGNITNAWISASAAMALSKLASGSSAQIIVGDGSGVPTYRTVTGDVTISNTGVTAIASGAIVNADISATAAIAISKLEGTSAGYIIVGDVTGDPVYTSVAGDVTIDYNGATTIGDTAVSTAKIKDNAVTSAKIADENITTAKLIDGLITNDKLGDTSITAAKIKGGDYGYVFFGDGVNGVTFGQLPTDGIADDAVTSAKMATNIALDGELTASKIIAGTKDHGFYAFEDSTAVINCTLDTWVQVTNTAGNLFTEIQTDEGFVISGDTITFNSTDSIAGGQIHVVFHWGVDGYGANNEDYEFRIAKIDEAEDPPYTGIVRKAEVSTTGANNRVSVGTTSYARGVVYGDKFILQVNNKTNSNNFTVENGSIYMEVNHY